MQNVNRSKELKQILDKQFKITNFAIFLAVVIFLCFPTVLTLQGTFMHRDYSAFGYPLAAYNRDCFWRGEIPLWNPYNACGIPYIAQWNTIFFYPPSLFYMIFPTQWSLGIFNILHMYFAGIGMYLLVKKWTKHSFAAAVGGVAFSFSGLIQYALMWPNDIATMSWMPWLTLAVENAIKQGGRWIPLAIVAGAFQMLSGFPEGIALTWLIIGALAVFVWTHEIKNSLYASSSIKDCPEEYKNQVFQVYKQTAARLTLTFISIILLSAIQLFPFFDLLIHSHRNPEYGQSFWAMPWFGWANLILPLFYCFPSPEGVFHQYDQQWTGTYYPGLAIFVIAIATLYKIRNRLVAVLSLLLAFGLVMALGDNGYLYKFIRMIFPFLGFIRFPVKFVLIATFVFPIIASIGIKFFIHNNEMMLSSVRNVSILVLLSLLILLLIQFKYPMEYDKPYSVLHQGLLGSFLTISIFLFLSFFIKQKSFKNPFLLYIILIFLWTDLAFHQRHINPVVPCSVYNPGNIPFNLFNIPQLGKSRAMIDPLTFETFKKYFNTTNNSFIPLLRISFLSGNCNLINKIPKVDGMYSLYPGEFSELIRHLYFFGKHTNISENTLNFLAVSYITKTNISWQFRTNTVSWVTYGQKPVFIEYKNSKLAPLLLAGIPFNEILLLPKEASYNFSTTSPAEAYITNKLFLPHIIEFEFDASEPSWIVLSLTYYHMWKAFSNKLRIPVWRANSSFMALKSSTGNQKIIIKYDDYIFKCALFLSTFYLVFIISLLPGTNIYSNQLFQTENI